MNQTMKKSGLLTALLLVILSCTGCQTTDPGGDDWPIPGWGPPASSTNAPSLPSSLAQGSGLCSSR